MKCTGCGLRKPIVLKADFLAYGRFGDLHDNKECKLNLCVDCNHILIRSLMSSVTQREQTFLVGRFGEEVKKDARRVSKDERQHDKRIRKKER